MYGVPRSGQIDFTKVVSLDLGTVTPNLAGPKRPQDRIELGNVKTQFTSLFGKPPNENGFNQPSEKLHTRYLVRAHDARTPTPDAKVPTTPSVKPGCAALRRGNGRQQATTLAAALHEAEPEQPAHGDSTVGNGRRADRRHHVVHQHLEPSVLLAAGLLAKKAVEAGLKVAPHIKTSLAPGSRIVTEYLTKAGLLPYLEKLGFNVAAYGCTTCIGNAGDLTPELNDAITKNDLVCAAVLSGNRNFEARIHSEPQGQLPGQPAAGRRLCDRRHGAARPDDRAGRQGQGAARTCTSAISGRPATRSPH